MTVRMRRQALTMAREPWWNFADVVRDNRRAEEIPGRGHGDLAPRVPLKEDGGAVGPGEGVRAQARVIARASSAEQDGTPEGRRC